MPKQTRKSSRNWTKVETNLFCEILIDPINNFMKTLQWKELIKTLAKEVYGLIAAGMRRAMKAEPFLSRNAACRKIKGNLLCHSIPTTSNYKQNTTKYTTFQTQKKNGSGLAGKDDPEYTAWKVSKYRAFSCPYFPTFGLNTERYGVSERYRISLRIQSEYGKIQTRKNSVFGHILRSGSLS